MKRRLIESDPCFLKAMDDEPGFVLLARDPLAPALVRLWASMRRAMIDNGGLPMSDLPQVTLAEIEAEKMVNWRRDAEGAWRDQHSLCFEN